MTTVLAAVTAISDSVIGGLETVMPEIEVQTDTNLPFEPPNGVAWARIYSTDGAKDLAGIGGTTNLWRGPIVTFVDVFIPLGAGDGLATDLCQAVRDACRGLTVSGLTLRRFEAGPAGPSDGYYRKQQIVVFDHNERG